MVDLHPPVSGRPWSRRWTRRATICGRRGVRSHTRRAHGRRREERPTGHAVHPADAADDTTTKTEPGGEGDSLPRTPSSAAKRPQRPPPARRVADTRSTMAAPTTPPPVAGRRPALAGPPRRPQARSLRPPRVGHQVSPARAGRPSTPGRGHRPAHDRQCSTRCRASGPVGAAAALPPSLALAGHKR